MQKVWIVFYLCIYLLYKLKIMKWISVADRLPYNMQNVIVFIIDYGVDTAYYDEEDNNFGWASKDGRQVTHWMVLPEEPIEN